MRASLRVFVFVLAALVLAAPGGPAARAATWQLTNIVDTTDLMPDGVTPFDNFDSPAIDGDTIVFRGGGGSNSGIFAYDGSAIRTVVDETTAVPGRSETFFSFGVPSLSGGNITFHGTFGPPDDRKEGLYKSIGGTLSTVADTETPIPDGTGSFSHLQALNSLWGTDVGFRGMGSLGQDGIYTSIGGTLARVADSDTAVPGGTGDFDWFYRPSFNGTSVAFQANEQVGASSFNGVYTNLGGTLHAVADENTLIPGETVNFLGFGYNVSLDGDRVAFNGGGSGQQGVFLYDDSEGGFTVVANQDTPIPGGTGSFHTFSYPSLDGENLAFFGAAEALGEDYQHGIYAFLDGELFEVVSTNMLLDDFAGYTSMEINFMTEGLSGTSLAFWVRFLDESDPFFPEDLGMVLYRADLVTSTIPEPASMCLVAAGLVSLAGLRRKVAR